MERDNHFFKENSYNGIARSEEGHFWFRYRNRLILRSIKKYSSDFYSFLEIGCGTGYVLSGVSDSFPDADLYGCDFFESGLSFASEKIPTCNLFRIDAQKLPFIDKFDVIGAFDVLEHIEEDTTVLNQMHTALKDKGTIFVTVPQHKWLWSPVDEYACHVRRYTEQEIHKKITNSGFKIVYSTSFMTLPLPAMIISRYKTKLEGKVKPFAELELNPYLNLCMEFIVRIEELILSQDIRLRIGGSRLVVAKKR